MAMNSTVLDSPLRLIVKNIVRAGYDGFALTRLMQEDGWFQGQLGVLRGSQNKGPSFFNRYMDENTFFHQNIGDSWSGQHDLP